MKAPTREQVRAALRRVDLLAFVQDTTQDYSAGWAHRMLAERLERFSDDISARRSPRLMIFTPPRFGKSQLVSRRFPVWHLARNPSHEVMLATYAQALSNDLNRDALQCAQMPETLASFPEFKLAPERQAVEQWKTDRGGGMVAIGVGGPATGRGAHALVIDDAVKGASEAASEIYREGQKAWYQQNARTRLAPGGGILITMCMTGNTPVLMADGTEKPLQDIRAGDAIATYDHGVLSSSVINRHKCCGPDSVYEIRTTCDRVVQANARHPFLVLRDGDLSWVRLRDLQVGDAMVRVSGSRQVNHSGNDAHTTCATTSRTPEGFATGTTRELSAKTPLATMASGLARFAAWMGAPMRFGARVCVRSTTTPLSMRLADVKGRRSKNGTPSCGTDTGSGLRTTMRCWKNSADFARSARGHRLKDLPPTGAAFCASTIATTPDEFADFSATTATSPLEGSRALTASVGFSLTYISSITLVGKKLVYDVEVARTENFIANGLVSHNTRWHQDDLAGWLLKQEQDGGERWEVICLPAIAATEERDAQGNVVRRAGEALHPERFDLAALTSLRAGLSPYAWAALYQQTPVPDGGGRIKSAWLAETRYVTIPHDANRVLHSWDTASKAGQLNDYSVCSVIRPYNQRAYLQDVYRQRLEFPALVSAVKSLAQRDNPYAVLIEDKGSGQALIQTLRRDPTFRWSIVPVNPMADKITRMDGVTPWLEGQRFYLPQSAPWLTDWETEVYSFPAAAHDDQIDSLSQALDYLGRENGLAVWRVIAEQRNHGPQRPVAIDTRMAYAIRGR